MISEEDNQIANLFNFSPAKKNKGMIKDLLKQQKNRLHHRSYVLKSLASQIVLLSMYLTLLSTGLLLIFHEKHPLFTSTELFKEIIEGEDIYSEMKNSTHILYVKELITGIAISIILMISIPKTFYFGVSISEGLMLSSVLIIQSVLLGASATFLAVDVLRFPNDKIGLIDPYIESYERIFNTALETPDMLIAGKSAKDHMWSISNRLKCCGIDRQQWQNEMTREINTRVLFSYNYTNEVIENQEILPAFCCKNKSMQCLTISKSKQIRHKEDYIWKEPCASNLVMTFLKQITSVIYASCMIIVICCVYTIQLLKWKAEATIRKKAARGILKI
ncbi:unnamed protein product [Auanema sp. JU1783]|nr:unnamed protein product [Auanema sp. JU1783]